MAEATFHFPKGFLWGTATAAYQVEGNNTNSHWYAWEQAGHTRGKAGLACDWWGGRWKEDMDRAAEGGQNAHRFSVEWSRIQPAPDRWDEDAIERYRAMARGMIERGLMPVVTIHHYSDPIWLTEMGAWETGAVVPLFEKFTRKVVEALKEYVSTWITINEPNAYALNSYLSGPIGFPPGKNDFKLAMAVTANLLRGHAAAYRAIHQIQPEARVGSSLYFRATVSKTSWSPLDKLASNIYFNGINGVFTSALAGGVMRSPIGSVKIPEAKGTQDFFGFNYYTRDLVSFDLRTPGTLFARAAFANDSELSETGFIASEPEGMFDGFKWVTKTFPDLPIIVTENGIDDSTDKIRPRYIAQHIRAMWRAVNFNWPVKGYFHWSLVDNFEWERAWTQRFGLWELDVETQARHKRPSADFYAEICKENGLSSEMVQKYCPELMPTLFPD